jgi:hypothetical protein
MKSRTAVAMAKPAAEEPKRSFFSSLFKKPVTDDEEEDEAPITKRSRMPAVAARVEPGNSVPLPPVRPAGKPPSIQVASPPERPAEATTTLAKTSRVVQVAAAVPPTAEAPIIEAPASKPALTYHAAAAARALEWSADALLKPPKFFQVAETSVDASARKSAPAPQVAAAPAEPPVAVSSPNDAISARAVWQGPVPPIPPAEIPNVSPAEAKAAARRHPDAIEHAASGSIAPWPMPSQKRESERVPAELALAYAAQVEAKERTTLARTPPVGITAARPAAAPASPPGSTVLVKQPAGTARAAQPVVSPVAAVAPVRTVQRLDNPWMRAMITTPSAQNFMTTMIIGANDFRTLRPFLHKPPFLVRMAFSDNPTPGLEPDHFRGEAIVFISTVTFSNRTALLH